MRKSKDNKKAKLIRRGHGKEPTVIEFNLSKAVIFLIIIGVLIAGIVTKEIVTTIIETNQKNLMASEEETINETNLNTESTITGETSNSENNQEENNNTSEKSEKSANGDLGYISSVAEMNISTGVGPFDENDEPGNDSSEKNDIVRSFDQITWTYELTFALKSGIEVIKLYGGTILIEAEIPKELASHVEWDLQSMNWLDEVQKNEDGTILYGKYIMNEEEATIPGKKTNLFVLNVLDVQNGMEIQPTFTFMLEGNEESEKVTKVSKKITTSATGRYNIQLQDYSHVLSDKTTVNYGGKDVSGRMYGYGVSLQLLNDNSSKELKGIEMYDPNQEISFDISLKVESVDVSSGQREDITNSVQPILWNYKENDKNPTDLSGNVEGRDMYFGGRLEKLYNNNLPDWNKDKGKIKIVQEDNILHVTINIFDYYFLSQDKNTLNKAIFSVGYMQLFLPDITEEENKEYYFTVEDYNMNIVSASGKTYTEQMNTSDDKSVLKYVQEKEGKFSQDIMIGDYGINPESHDAINMESQYGAGDAKSNIGKYIWFDSRCILDTTNDYDIYTVNRFVKFDGEAFEPQYTYNGAKYLTFNMQGNAEFNVWYVTKPDGSNWIDQNEMNNANIEDLELYSLIEEIPENKICVGIYFENYSGYLSKASGNNNNIFFPIKIKDTAQIGKTYGITLRTIYWREQLDREIYTVENKDIKYLEDWPEPEWDSGNFQYVKTEYDEDGKIIVGTNLGGNTYGNTVLVVGANLHGDIFALDNNYSEKINYNLDKNENTVKYLIEPKLDKNEDLTSQIEDVILKAEVILPKGLTYKLGSSKRGGEEYQIQEIIENEDGTTTLVWKIYGVTSGQPIEPIEFEAQIAGNTTNGTQYTTSFIISEDLDENAVTKIGNSEIKFRTSTNTINVTSLESYRLYKEVEPPVIEKNGEMHFKITFNSSSNVKLPDFRLLDIMPYNGDARGTKFSGTYTIKNITISQKTNGVQIDNSNLKLYYSQDAQVRIINVKNETIGTSGIWKEVQENAETKTYEMNLKQENDGITGIAIKGELAGFTEVVVDICIKTEENEGEDKYVNSVTGQTDVSTEEIRSSDGVVQVIERIIEGIVWEDRNYNNIIDNNESLGEINKDEVILKLYKVEEDGTLTQALNVDGKAVEGIHPDETGKYEFWGLPAEDYVVKIEFDGDKYKLVEKEAVFNTEINSKFELETNSSSASADENDNIKIGKTDIIISLNNNNNLKLIEENVNAGLKEKINLEFTKVAEEDHTDKIEGTEFKLYKLVCTEHEDGYHDTELINSQSIESLESDEIANLEDGTNNSQNIENKIDTNNAKNSSSCWQLVDTQTSKIAILNEEQGNVKFKDLELNQEYRLVETKASINRIKPEGQWKIEFSLENLNAEQNAEITKINNGVEIKIEAIGNVEPPAFAITKNEETGIIEELLLPNRAYFQFPASGSIGSKTIYKIGVTILILGIVILIIRKKNLKKIIK